MYVPKVSILVSPQRLAPPGALWLAHAAAGLFGSDRHAGYGLFAWVRSVRAKAAVERSARREARDRGELMALARRYQSTQPSFAKDLIAAASSERR